MIHKIIFSFLFFISLAFIGCNPKGSVTLPEVQTLSKPEKAKEQKPEPAHSYGGWYCPDNILGFPAVDVKQLDQIPVVTGRLPTKEETYESKSLIYIDTLLHPSAKPLDIPLPALARYYSEYTKKHEMVVVIQAVMIGQDSIVGFRFLNGGNGSGWLKEVTFVSEEEEQGLGSTPFVTDGVVINAFPKVIWEVITSPTYAKLLGAMFDKRAYMESTWEKNAEVYFKYEPDRTVTTGTITAIWKNLYIQIDYDFDGHHYVEKILLLKNKEEKNTEIQMTAGPYGEDYVAQKLVWHKWLNKVKELSERKMNLQNYFGVGDKVWE